MLLVLGLWVLGVGLFMVVNSVGFEFDSFRLFCFCGLLWALLFALLIVVLCSGTLCLICVGCFVWVWMTCGACGLIASLLGL